MIRVPPVPYYIRAALTLPLFLVAGLCMWLIAWITPEVEGR